MPINLQELLTVVVGTLTGGTLVLGAVGWLTKTLISHQLARRTEEFKANLKSDAEREIEHLKSSLQMAALEHQVRFSKLHERRAEVIAQVYERLIDLQQDYGRFVIVDGHETDQEKRAKATEAIRTKMYETSILFEKSQIYLPAYICALLKDVVDVMWKSTNAIGIYISIDHPTAETVQEKNKHLSDGYKLLTKQLPIMREAMEDEFRRLLGDNNTPSTVSPPESEPSLASKTASAE